MVYKPRDVRLGDVNIPTKFSGEAELVFRSCDSIFLAKVSRKCRDGRTHGQIVEIWGIPRKSLSCFKNIKDGRSFERKIKELEAEAMGTA